MKATSCLFYLLLLVCALNTTHNAVYNQCILFINQDLLGTSYQLKLTLSVYFCAIFFVRCLVGVVIDGCSGKKCILIGLWVALLGHTMAGFSNNIYMFIAARFIQGLGLGGCQVIGLVLLMRLFSTKGRASIIAAEQVFFSLASIVLPLMGGLLSLKLTWRLTYLVYFLITVFSLMYFYVFQPKEINVALPESNLLNDPNVTSHHLLMNSKFLIPTLMSCFSISGYILWGSYFSLLVHHFGINVHYLLMYQLLPIIPYFTCSLLFKKFTKNLPKSVLYCRIFCFQFLAYLSIFLLYFWDKSSFSFKFCLLLPILLHNVAGAFFRPLMQEKALNAVPNNKIGMASSFISICQVGVNAIFSIIINCMSNFIVTYVTIQLFIITSILMYVIFCRNEPRACGS